MSKKLTVNKHKIHNDNITADPTSTFLMPKKDDMRGLGIYNVESRCNWLIEATKLIFVHYYDKYTVKIKRRKYFQFHRKISKSHWNIF